MQTIVWQLSKLWNDRMQLSFEKWDTIKDTNLSQHRQLSSSVIPLWRKKQFDLQRDFVQSSLNCHISSVVD